MNANLQNLNVESSLLLVVDIQGKLARLMHQPDDLIKQTGILIEACKLLQIPIVWAEQLPEKLGPTVSELAEKLEGLTPYPKASFGCCENTKLAEAIRRSGRFQILLCGIEAHVCVWQTAASLLREGFQVHIVSDAISSRSQFNRDVGLQRIIAAGGQTSCVEMALFELMGSAEHPKFREIAKLVK